MDRFFSTLPFGKAVKRANWAVQSSTNLFKLDGNHLSTSPSSVMAPSHHTPTPTELAEWEKAASKVNIQDCYLRCERQTLHRLEKTGAVVFAFKTYLYPLREVKEEGSGEEMAAAVEGFGRGSVPGMKVYKRGVIWGDKVLRFLRGEE
jgi:hypothetical protein